VISRGQPFPSAGRPAGPGESRGPNSRGFRR